MKGEKFIISIPEHVCCPLDQDNYLLFIKINFLFYIFKF